jgi:hypothetical protein
MAMDDARMATMVATKREVEDELLSRPGVHTVSISRKIVSGQPTDELVITIHVAKKKPLAELAAAEVIPQAFGNFITDVIEHEQPRPHVDSKKYRPLVGGCQLAFSNWLGTLGAFASQSGTVRGLTNQHVVPNSGDVYQPNNDKDDKIGAYVKAVLSSDVDGAIVSLDTSYSNTILQIGTVNGSRTVTAVNLGETLRKRGRTSGLTTGPLFSVDASGTRTDGWTFRNQMIVNGGSSPYSQPGDSGSVIVDSSARVVGLLWGAGGNLGYGSPIAAVQSQLGVTILSGAVTRTSETIAIRDRTHLRQHVQAQLAGSPDGTALVAFWNSHEDQLVELIHHHKKVLVTWTRNRGDDIVRLIANAIQDGEQTLPEAIDGMPLRQALENIEADLLACGDDALKKDLRAIRPIFERIYGTPFPQALDQLRKEHPRA